MEIFDGGRNIENQQNNAEDPNEAHPRHHPVAKPWEN
jgi:hypothetical protein